MFLSMLLSGNIDFMSAVIYISSTLLVIFLVLPFHEWAHGFMAYKLGDNTAKLSGRLTLNPLAHIDPFGSLLLLLIGFGWAKPVPVDARNFKNPKVGMAITAFAGPVANLIAAIGAGLVMHLIMLILSLNNIAAYDGNSFQLKINGEVWGNWPQEKYKGIDFGSNSKGVAEVEAAYCDAWKPFGIKGKPGLNVGHSEGNDIGADDMWWKITIPFKDHEELVSDAFSQKLRSSLAAVAAAFSSLTKYRIPVNP